MPPLQAREAYSLWAPRYEAETAVSDLENQVVSALSVAIAGKNLLDVGCGTARRLRDTGAARAIGVDLTFEMLARAREDHMLASADVSALPFADGSFDVVWCRLVIGHVRDVGTAYRELARVCRVGGCVIVSDISPHAIAAGHRRTFQDAGGTTHEVEHVVHSSEAQAHVANNVGLTLELQRDGIVGPTVRQFYADAGRLPAYEAQQGLSMVRALLWRKERV